MSIEIQIEYYAKLKDITNKTSETIQTKATNALEFFNHLNELYPIDYPQHDIQVAINDEFCTWETPLNHSDKIVFIPPVAGG